MREQTLEIVQMLKDAQRVQSSIEIVMKQFEIAATMNNQEEIEKVRVAAHEYLDQLLDLRQRLASLQNDQMNEILKELKKK